MSELINYLNSPHLVANFQKIFGIESQFDDSSMGIKSYKFVELSTTKSTSMASKPVKSQTNFDSKKIQTRSRANNNSSNTATTTVTITKEVNKSELSSQIANAESSTKTDEELKRMKKLVNSTDDKNIIANTTIHIKFWYYFFRFGAAMGNEIFYCNFIRFKHFFYFKHG